MVEATPQALESYRQIWKKELCRGWRLYAYAWILYFSFNAPIINLTR
jgi:hypothetical protein